MNEIEILPKDLRWEFFRYAGTTSKASRVETVARLTHTPTGICVEADESISRFQNRVSALRMLKYELGERSR